MCLEPAIFWLCLLLLHHVRNLATNSTLTRPSRKCTSQRSLSSNGWYGITFCAVHTSVTGCKHTQGIFMDFSVVQKNQTKGNGTACSGTCNSIRCTKDALPEAKAYRDEIKKVINTQLIMDQKCQFFPSSFANDWLGDQKESMFWFWALKSCKLSSFMTQAIGDKNSICWSRGQGSTWIIAPNLAMATMLRSATGSQRYT